MFVDISKPPPPLPVPRCTAISPGVSLLQPLSRRGTGPGMIIVVPDSTQSNLSIIEGVPSPLIKWAEESYTVVEIQESAISSDIIQRAIKALFESESCVPKEKVGIVVYNGHVWNLIAPLLSSTPEISGAVIYTNAEELSSLLESSIPCLKHLSGNPSSTNDNTSSARLYTYPSAKSSSFALPFQDDFSYSLEALSHTRNLTFLKPLMNGPYFDLEQIWDEHTYFEFENRSVEWTMSTMVQEPYVNHIPTMTGGVGREKLSDFYANHFIFKNPADAELEVISRTVGIDRVVDEFIYKITHDFNIRGDRLYHEHIAWDQGTVLSQLDIIPEYLRFAYPVAGQEPKEGKRFEIKVPVAAATTAAKIRDRNAVESNGMFAFKVREVEN
uniref:Carboxymethylenebutenolidase n=1 Tax=Talaromyces marneffei PM1 TaxID=1077442 RepID=A0A093ULB5_TALMA